jgi:hypothetical protein
MTRGLDLRWQGACAAELVLPGAGDEQTNGERSSRGERCRSLPDERVQTGALGYSAWSKLSFTRRMGMKRLLTLAPIAALLAACEDAGNSGDDNLLTGGSLVLIVIIVVIVLVVRSRRELEGDPARSGPSGGRGSLLPRSRRLAGRYRSATSACVSEPLTRLEDVSPEVHVGRRTLGADDPGAFAEHARAATRERRPVRETLRSPLTSGKDPR